MNQQTYRNRYKTHPDRKEKIIFFVSGGFYRTFDSDALLLSQLFGFQIQMQGGYKMVGFPSSAAGKYFDLLQQEDYGYALLQIDERGIHILNHYQGTKSLELVVPMEVFSGLLDDIQSILHRYESVMRIVKQVDFSSHSSIHQEDTGDIPILDFPSETESTPSEAEHTSSDAPKGDTAPVELFRQNSS